MLVHSSFDIRHTSRAGARRLGGFSFLRSSAAGFRGSAIARVADLPVAVRARALPLAASAFSRAGAGGEKPRHGSDREIQRRVTMDAHVACHVASMYRAGSAARAPRCVEQARSATLRVRGVGSLGGGEVGGAWCARAACVAQHIPTFLILQLRRSTRRRRGAAGTRGARRGACRHAWGRRRPRRGHRGAAAAHGRHLPRGMLGAARGNRRGHRSAEAQHLRFEAVVSPGGS